ncbi:hypothetical protein M2152_001564 [Microbacteriaceae bacterium SG_E_30_P1]|uniref:PKD domain-containing protein n=1 Tax=Antiquaquibacter oligotrophicus TaxID=2880260 RepID=A0ABT6KQB3_9MICO|nr:hypothetical protein [Antiquaquibacter oligotrophicus]MDH6181382.1 hypothetical protein [Antiquaquibacter oligotrophicus]UDF12925.1 PKD domain-containing protein [Antiquaquibacter oligotrophicus]
MVELLLVIATMSLSGCGHLDVRLEACTSASISDDSVTLDTSLTLPGDETTDSGTDDADTTEDLGACMQRQTGLECWTVTAPPEASIAPVTLADIANFRPAVGEHYTQPRGWAVVSLPTNVVSSARPQTVDGVLLGAPATVRFTPTRWTWDYGDGTQRTTRSGGDAWENLRLREFDHTGTSHVFQNRGRYEVSLRVDFAAEYRIGDGTWTAIEGLLTVVAPPVSVTVVRASTVLVDADCTRKRSVGC